MTIGVLHPGAMGAAIGGALAGAGHDVVWAAAGRSDATARRAADAGLRDVAEVGELARVSDVVLSICPPDAAIDVARAVAGAHGVFVDANAIGPHTAEEVAGVVGPGYVDGGIIGPPPSRSGTTRLYLAGAGAGTVAALFAGTAVDARVLAPAVPPMAASALKMAYAAWTKGSAALLLAIEEVARGLDVDDALREEWALSQPELAERLAAARTAAASKGWRWTGEMREIAETFEAAGQPGGFGRAAAKVYER